MMELGLEVMRQRGAQGCALVGDPAYYQRFGFQANPDLVLPEVPPENFMVLSFNKDLPAGEVCFHRAFTL
jgi:predicted N-acetyltransferase YhbS